MGTLTAEDFNHTPSARMKVLAVQCGEAFVNDNTVGAVWKSPDSFLHGRNGLISDTGDIRRPVKQQVTSKRFDETGHQWESIAPMAGIKLNIKAVRVDKHDKPVFGLRGNEVGDFGDHLLDILKKNGVELQDLRLPGARAQKSEMMIIDEYDRGREQMEQNIVNATQNWEAAKKMPSMPPKWLTPVSILFNL